jgi:hypothetical protein
LIAKREHKHAVALLKYRRATLEPEYTDALAEAAEEFWAVRAIVDYSKAVHDLVRHLWQQPSVQTPTSPDREARARAALKCIELLRLYSARVEPHMAHLLQSDSTAKLRTPLANVYVNVMLLWSEIDLEGYRGYVFEPSCPFHPFLTTRTVEHRVRQLPSSQAMICSALSQRSLFLTFVLFLSVQIL